MQIDRERLARALNCAWIECDSLPPIVFTDGEADALCNAILAEIEAQGLVIAPREPTEAMVDAGSTHDPEDGCCPIWDAMIAAAKGEGG